MTCSRRKFLAAGTFSLGVIIFGGVHSFMRRRRSIFNQNDAILLSPSVISEFGDKSSLSWVELNSMKVTSIPLPIRVAHSCTGNLFDRDKIYVFDTGEEACEVSLSRKSSTRSFKPIDNGTFGGHGEVSKSGILYCSERDRNGRGFIVGRNLETLEVIFSFPSAGYHCHEIRLMEDLGLIAIANEGLGHSAHKQDQYSNFSLIDIKSGKVHSQYAMDSGKREQRHMVVSNSGRVVLAVKRKVPRSNYEKTKAQVFLEKGERRALKLFKAETTQYMAEPLYFTDTSLTEPQPGLAPQEIVDRMINTNSIALNERAQILGASHTQGGMISFWNLKNRELISHYAVNDTPRGITYSEESNAFFFQTMNNNVYRVDSPTLPPKQLDGVKIHGYAHIMMW